MKCTIIATTLIIICISILALAGIMEKSNKRRSVFVIITTGILAVAISLLFYGLLDGNHIESKYNDFLAFEGTIIASVVALLGVVFTLKKTHDENEEKNNLEKKKFEFRLRVESAPMLVYELHKEYNSPLFYPRTNGMVDCSINGEDYKEILVVLSISCVGNNAAKDLELEEVRIKGKYDRTIGGRKTQIFLPGETENIYQEICRLPLLKSMDDCHRSERIEITFKVGYKDIYQNKYTQEIEGIIFARKSESGKIEYEVKQGDLNKPEIELAKLNYDE